MMTDAEIIAIAKATDTAEPGTDGYTLPVSFARATIAAHTAKVLEGMEPIAWMRPSITDNGYTYDSSYRDNNGYVKESTRREQGFKPLYTADQLAAAITTRDQRIAELENEIKAWALTVDNLEAKLCLNAPQIVT